MSKDIEYVIIRFVMLLALPKVHFHREADDIHNRWFKAWCQERVQYYDNSSKKA